MAAALKSDRLAGPYGVLLYTGTTDAEGTLGGLIEVGRRLLIRTASNSYFPQLMSVISP